MSLSSSQICVTNFLILDSAEAAITNAFIGIYPSIYEKMIT